MAKKKPEVNKSELIRKHIAQHADHKPAQIVEALKAHKVSVGLVNAVRAKLNAKKRGKKKAATKSTAHSNGHATEFVKSAFHIGLDKAIQLLERVKKAVE